MDALKFFQNSSGKWRSQRTTHHLAFRRAEIGDSEIYVEALEADNPKIIEICQMHDVAPALAVGGAFVSWDGSMAWDRNDENHTGTTIFALIPEKDNPREGVLLRESFKVFIMVLFLIKQINDIYASIVTYKREG